MKTQTSSTKKWIKTLVVLPLLAILIFGFSKKEEVVKEVTPLITENNDTNSPPVLEVKKNQSLLLLNNENTSLESLGEDFLSITKGEKSDLKIISEENIKMSFIEQISEALKPNLLQIYFESEYGITHDNFNFNSDKEIINKHIENKPLLEFINGIKTDCNQCAVSKSLIGQLAITTTLDETVEEFKIQFKNEDAFLVTGNQLDARAQELLKKMNHNDLVFIYDIKTKFKTFKNKLQLKAKITKQDENEGASEEQMQEYRNFINEYKSTNVVYSEKHKRAVIIYNQLMTDKQRASVDKYPSNLIPDSNLSKTQPKQPTSSEFESWKNEKEFAIWLDGKPIPNSNLNKLSANDIVHYTGSFIHNNARSDRFPQPYQYSLYTKKGFENTYQKANVNQYKKASEAYTNAIQNFLKGSQEDNSELKILKAQADKIYNTFTKEELKENNILQTPPLPAQKKAFNNWVKVENILEQSSQDNKGVTKEELEEYNTLAKHINSQISESEYPIVKHKDAVRVKYLYNKMSKEQKESAEAFPDFSKLPPPPPPAPDPNVKTGFITINNSTHYYVTQNGNTKYYNRYGQETNKEGTIINDTQVDGDKVIPGQKITKVYKDNKVVSEFNKNWNQDVPPPPPPPKSPLDHIIDMAKKGAAFYYEGKSISSDEAIALLKKNNELNISTQQTDSKQAKVYITKAPVSIKN